MVKRFVLYILPYLIFILGLSFTPIAAQESVCTLSDRIKSANTNTAVGNCPAGTSHDIITFAEDITLTEALPPITGTITIEGGGHTISGDSKHRIFEVRGGRLTIKNLTLTKGRVKDPKDIHDGGGAILIRGHGTLNISNSAFIDNSAPYEGGAIGGATNLISPAYGSTNITINNSSFIGNYSYSGGVIDTIEMPAVKLNITSSSFIRNRATFDGGAVYIRGDHRAVVNIANSTFKDNSARDGGAINARNGEITLTHLTMVNNTATGGGSAVWTPTTRFSSYFPDLPKLSLFNSLISGSSGIYADDCEGRLIESQGNLSDESCTPVVDAAPRLGEATGSPAYFPLQDGSPALDAADPKYCLPTDQLGNQRPRGAGCDIGAIESTTAIPVPTPVPAVCPLDDQIIAANTDRAVGPCPAGNSADVIHMVRDFTLADRLPPITSEITILGNGYTISGDDRFGIFEVDGGRLTIKDVTLTRGSTRAGGAINIKNGGAVTVENVTFIENVATDGGAIATEHYNSRLDVRNSSFLINRADENGGAIFANGGIVNISDSAFKANLAVYHGGALHGAEGQVSVSNSTFAVNLAVEGGGIYVSGAETTLTHLTLMNNRASQIRGAGIYKEAGLLYLRNSIVAGSGSGDDCFGMPNASRGNFSQDGSCGTQPGGDPLLQALTGAPAYHTLQYDSRAQDEINCRTG